MAPEPPQRQLLYQLLEALKGTTSDVIHDEPNERRNVINNRAYSSVIDARVQNLNKDLDVLNVVRELMKQQQTVLERLQASAHNAAQPVCRLPDEILGSIFQVGVPGVVHCWNIDPRRTHKQWSTSQYKLKLRSIGATCSRFRTTQIATPRCWTYLHCLISGGNIHGTLLEELEVMLTRSRNCGFCLRLTVNTYRQEYPSEFILRAISRLLLPHMHRCQSLRLGGDDRSVEFPVLISETPLRSLQSISFDWSRDRPQVLGDQNPDDQAQGLIHRLLGAIDAPLHDLGIQGVLHSSDLVRQPLSNIQANALTRLLIDGRGSMAHIYHLLQRCSNLEHLKWILQRHHEEAPEICPERLTMNNLISLRIHNLNLHGTVCFLHAPKLEQIHLSGNSRNMPFDILHVKQPPFPSLARVAFLLHPDVVDLTPFFLRQPHLTECSILMGYYENDTSSHMSVIIEALLHASADAQAGLRHSLQRLSLNAHLMKSAVKQEEIPVLLELVLQRFPNLRINFHLPRSFKLGLKLRNFEHQARVFPSPPLLLEMSWPTDFAPLEHL